MLIRKWVIGRSYVGGIDSNQNSQFSGDSSTFITSSGELVAGTGSVLVNGNDDSSLLVSVICFPSSSICPRVGFSLDALPGS